MGQQRMLLPLFYVKPLTRTHNHNHRIYIKGVYSCLSSFWLPLS